MQLVLANLKKSFGSKEVLKGASFTFEDGKTSSPKTFKFK